MNNSDDRRAQVIAQFDYIRAELPDVFFLNGLTSDGSSAAAAAYPLNFAASPYPSGTNTLSSGNQTNGAANDGGSWVLPLGNNYPGLPGFYSSGLLNLSITTPQLPATGMFGASFSAAAWSTRTSTRPPRPTSSPPTPAAWSTSSRGSTGSITTATGWSMSLSRQRPATPRWS